MDRLAFPSHERQPHGVTAVAITPGGLRSEMTLDFAVAEELARRLGLTAVADPTGRYS